MARTVTNMVATTILDEDDAAWALKVKPNGNKWTEYQSVANFVATLERDEGSEDWFDDESLHAVIWYSNDDQPAINISVRFYGEGRSHVPCCHLYLDHEVDMDDPAVHHAHEGGDALSLLTKLRWGNEIPDDWFGRRYMQSYLDKLYRMSQAGRTAYYGGSNT